MRGTKVADDFMERAEKGIILPQAVTIHSGVVTTTRNIWDRTTVAEVLAVGPNVGRPCSKRHMAKFKRARWLADTAGIGDLLMFEDKNFQIGIEDSPFVDYEKFVEESVPIAIYRP
jgi:hypothetical protein